MSALRGIAQSESRDIHQTKALIRLRAQSAQVRAVQLALLTIAYAGTLFVLQPVLGAQTVALSALPLLYAGWVFGAGAAAVASVAGAALTAALLLSAGGVAASEMVSAGAVALQLTISGAAIITGAFSDWVLRAERLQSVLWSVNSMFTDVLESLERDIDAARRLQEALLPEQLPQNARVQFASLFAPCEQVGGDIFNVIPLSGGRYGVYIIDVSGHGLDAAVYSVGLTKAISTMIDLTPDQAEPRQIMDRLNEKFPLRAPSGQFFTLLYGLLHPDSGEFRFISAGHPGPIHVPCGGGAHEIEVSGFPIGVVKQPRYREHVLRLGPGDRMLLYSDGITELPDPGGAMLGVEGLISSLETRRGQPLASVMGGLREDLRAWRGDDNPPDDITACGIELSAADA